MKYIKIRTALLDKINNEGVTVVPIINDQDNLMIDEKIDFFDDANVAFGRAIINQISLRRLKDIIENDSETTELIRLNYDLDDVEETSSVKIISFDYKIYDEPRKISNNAGLDTTSVKIYADGGSRGNPGPSASGYVILTDKDELIKAEGIYVGITTNNQAEYRSIRFALESALQLGAKYVSVFMDSLLVINQLNGSFKIKKPELIPIYQDIKELATKFETISFVHVPRALNKLADAEVNKSLDEELGIS